MDFSCLGLVLFQFSLIFVLIVISLFSFLLSQAPVYSVAGLLLCFLIFLHSSTCSIFLISVALKIVGYSLLSC